MDNSSSNSHEFYLRTSFLSGAASSIGLFLHLLFLAFIFFTHSPAPLIFLVPTYLGTLVLSEYIFWGILKSRTSIKFTPKQLFDLKEKNYFWAAYFSELLFDTILLVTALKAGWTPLNFYMIYLGCRFLSAPFQVLLYNYYLSRNASYALGIALQLFILFTTQHPDLILYALIMKGVLCNVVSLARAQFADEALRALQSRKF